MSTLISCRNRDSSLSRLLDTFFGSDVPEPVTEKWSFPYSPKVDVIESSDKYTITADLPGMDKKDVRISVEDGVLTIAGEHKSETVKKDTQYHYLERSSGKFSRAFTLPEEVDSSNINASMKNGVLELTLPKNEKAKPKSIEVKVL